MLYKLEQESIGLSKLAQKVLALCDEFRMKNGWTTEKIAPTFHSKMAVGGDLGSYLSPLVETSVPVIVKVSANHMKPAGPYPVPPTGSKSRN